ncbi:MAG: hypothetical protein RL264_2094 [Bacteroidota bacterium]|jgi:SanA protein
MLKRFITFVFYLPVFTLLIVAWSNAMVEFSTDEKVYDSVSDIPEKRVGLLLGTSRYVLGNIPNHYFFNRIEAAIELYRAGKIDKIVVSGDNSVKGYNEPQDMMDELVKRGFPAENIYLDYAGFRTFDSVYRMEYIFGQKKFIIVSQEFHNRRAIVIAQKLNLDAIGYNAKDVSQYYGFKTQLREKFARTKMYLDFLFGIQPKFLGEKIKIH